MRTLENTTTIGQYLPATDRSVKFRGKCPLSNSSQVVVVVPDYGLRRSLEFALEVEGFAVLAFDEVNAAIASPSAGEARCIVVDEEALLNDPSAIAAVRQFHKPVLLLVDRSRPGPDTTDVRVFRKPVIGNALIRAIKLTGDRDGTIST